MSEHPLADDHEGEPPEEGEAIAQAEAQRGATDFRVLKLKRDEERRLAAGHLWVFSNEVDTQATPLVAFEPGQVVDVRSSRDKFMGYGYVNPKSLISARIVSRHAEYPPSKSLFVHRILVARSLRDRLYAQPYYRLVYGESDGLPGLVVDRYDDILVVQIATAGMEAQKGAVLAALTQVMKPRGILLKNDSGAREQEGLAAYVEVVAGVVPDFVTVPEAGLKFTAPLASGQKTGWFYDQAANRAQFLGYTHGAKRILDVCGYLGAWGIRAAAGTDAKVTMIDASASAIEYATANAAANGVAFEGLKGDAFQTMETLNEAREKFDLVILDPPAFIKRRKDVHKGAAAYRRLNQLAMQLMGRDALLVSCSCSYHLEAGGLESAIQKGARHLGRFVQVLASGGQSPDHPVHPAIPETRYLKALLARVTPD